MHYSTNHQMLSQVDRRILALEPVKKPLQNLTKAKEALAALAGKYAASHAQWKADAQALPLGAPIPLEPSSTVPFDVMEDAKLRVRFAEEALTSSVAESRDFLMDVVKERQAEVFEGVEFMIADLNKKIDQIHELARSALWIDDQSPVHPGGRQRHLILTMDAPALIKAVAKGSTFIDNETGRV